MDVALAVLLMLPAGLAVMGCCSSLRSTSTAEMGDPRAMLDVSRAWGTGRAECTVQGWAGGVVSLE